MDARKMSAFRPFQKSQGNIGEARFEQGHSLAASAATRSLSTDRSRIGVATEDDLRPHPSGGGRVRCPNHAVMPDHVVVQRVELVAGPMGGSPEYRCPRCRRPFDSMTAAFIHSECQVCVPPVPVADPT